MRKGGNPNIKEAYKLSTGPISDIGKFKVSINSFKKDLKVHRDIPPELIDLFAWYKALNKKEIDYLLELKNLAFVLKSGGLPSLLDKALHNESFTRKDIDTMRLLKDILVESHKLKYGDRKVIERVVTYEDVRKQMFASKSAFDSKGKILTAEVIKNEPVPQDSDSRGRGEGAGEKDGEDSGDNGSAEED